MPREPLAVQNNSRDAARQKDSWGTNCFIDGAMARGRPGAELSQKVDAVGLGLAEFEGTVYSFVKGLQSGQIDWGQAYDTYGTPVLQQTETIPFFSVCCADNVVWLFVGSTSGYEPNWRLYKSESPYTDFTLEVSELVTSEFDTGSSLVWFNGELLFVQNGTLLAYNPATKTLRTALGAAAVLAAGVGRTMAVLDGFVYTRGSLQPSIVVESIQRSSDLLTWETVYAPGFDIGVNLVVANKQVYALGVYANVVGTAAGTWKASFDTVPSEQYAAVKNSILGFSLVIGPLTGAGNAYSFTGKQIAAFTAVSAPFGGYTSDANPAVNSSVLIGGYLYYYAFRNYGGAIKLLLSLLPGIYVYNTAVDGDTPYSVVPGYAGFFIKNETNAYWFNGTTFTLVTDSNYPAATVPGAVFLDGTYYVMDSQARIWGCKTLNDATVWDPLNVLTATSEPDGGVAIARQLQYIVAFGAYTTEFFYDAGNATGSPLLPYSSALLELGCANGYSVAQSDNQTIFMGVSKQKGRAIYRLTGTTPDLLSTPAIDRVITADDLSDVSSFCVRITGANFYVLTLGQSGVTLACDLATKDWKEWTSLTAGTALNLARLDYANGVVTSSGLTHGLQNGDPVLVAGTGEDIYDGYYLAAVSSPTVFSYTPLGVPLVTSVISTGTVTTFSSGPFIGRAYTGFGVWDLVQSSNGSLYSLSTDYTTDGAAPIDIRIRTAKIDAGSDKRGFTGPLEIIGDKVQALAYLRHSGDDYQTWSNWRPVRLGTKRSQLNRLGSDRRRAYELRCIADAEVRFEALELDLTKGVS